MTTERQAAKADAKDVDLEATERAADLWLALALRKLARDSALNLTVGRRLERLPSTVRDVLNAVADHLEGA